MAGGYHFLKRLGRQLPGAAVRVEMSMPRNRPIKQKKRRPVPIARVFGRPAKSRAKSRAGFSAKARHAIPRAVEIERTRTGVETAIENARKSHERLREAIDILPQGIVF